jgi:uncharacterized repeat protein (TIGR01451 family)
MGLIGTDAASRLAARVVTAATIVLVLLGILAPAARAASSPDVTISKSSGATGSLSVGDRFSYTITVSNVGTATAHKVVVQDNLPRGLAVRTIVPPFPGGSCTVTSSQVPPAPPAWAVRCTRDVLEPALSATVSFEVEVTEDARCGALTNRATVSASDEPSAATGDNSATATDTVACVPSIALDTTAPAYTHVGASVPFTMKVHNDGEVALGSVDLTGPGCSPTRIGNGNGDATLGVSETWIYRCMRSVGAATPDPLTATASVVAWTDAEQRVTASDRATVRVLDPGISIALTPEPISGSPGDTITYTYLVTNTGDAALSDISVDDDQLGHIGDIASLQAGHSATLQATRLLRTTAVWVTNTATAHGTDAGGRAVSASDEASVTIVAGSGGIGHGDGTAFTGSGTASAATTAVLLALVGVGLLLADRRRA